MKSIVIVNDERAVCRKYLAAMAGLYEADAIEATFGAGMCELDCDDCEHNEIEDDKETQREFYFRCFLCNRKKGILTVNDNGICNDCVKGGTNE